MKINWESLESHILCNPRYPAEELLRFESILSAAAQLDGHIWLSTSGSSVQKWVGLSKQAILASAEAVNLHLRANQKDCWVNALPFFHAGGLGIQARAYLSGARLIDVTGHFTAKWCAATFYDALTKERGTLTALVPAQLYDLISMKRQAPASLRAVIIGGGGLLPALYAQAAELGWPLLPSYGLTECASQVATAELDSLGKGWFPSLKLLSHLQTREEGGRICVKGLSLFTTYATFEESKVCFADPKDDGWFMTEDRGEISGMKLTLLGRVDEMVKVGGENVDIARLEQHLQSLRLKMGMRADVALVAIPDERLGHSLCCATDGPDISQLVDQYQLTVLPFERIRRVVFMSELPRSPLGKTLRGRIRDLIGQSTLK